MISKNFKAPMLIQNGKVKMLPILIIHLQNIYRKEDFEQLREHYIEQFGYNVVLLDARVKSYSVLTNAKDEEFILIEKGGKID